MDPARSSVDGFGSRPGEAAEEDLGIQEIRSLMVAKSEPGPQSGSSFTALLGLPSAQAMELLHEAGAGLAHRLISPSAAAAAAAAADVWRGQKFPLDDFAFGCFPTFPSNLELVDRAATFSVFAAEESSSPPRTTSSGRSNSALYSSAKGAVKAEPADSDSNANSSAGSKPRRRPARRKQQEKGKAKGTPAKRARTSAEDSVRKAAAENNGGEREEKLPYVHVRARRGQATDSHSLAERARREKINARMKLLQELVPGCNKISGTAQVLDEIINHVQSLQRQVEFLSMRLATVKPGIDFCGADSFFAASGRMQEASAGEAAGMEQLPLWFDAHRRPQIWLADLPSPQSPPTFFWASDDDEHHDRRHGLVPLTSSPFEDDAVNTVTPRANRLKQEI